MRKPKKIQISIIIIFLTVFLYIFLYIRQYSYAEIIDGETSFDVENIEVEDDIEENIWEENNFPSSVIDNSNLYITTPAPDVDAYTPPLASAVKFTAISNFELGGAAIDASNYVWTWGYNGVGRTGVGTMQGYLGGMRRIPFFIDNNIKIIDIVSGYQNTFAISEEGKAYAWGNNTAGALGRGSTTAGESIPKEVQIPLKPGERVTLIDPSDMPGGNNTTVYAVTNLGRVFAWGYNPGGMIPGYGTVYNPIPIEMASITDLGKKNNGIKSIKVGHSQVLLLTNNGKVFSWGINYYGSLGLGTTSGAVTQPTEITGLKGINVTEISAGYDHSMALGSNGEVYQWGQVFGYSGYDATAVGTPSIVDYDYSSALYKPIPQKISAGMYSGYIVDQHGRFWIWGRNVFYQFMQDGPLYGTSPTVALYNWKNPLAGKLDQYLSKATQIPKSLGDGDTQYNHTVPKAPVFSGYTLNARFNMTIGGYESAGVWSDIDDLASKKHPTIYDKKYYQTTGTMGSISEGANLTQQKKAHEKVYLIDKDKRKLVYVIRKEHNTALSTLSGNFYVAQENYTGNWFVDNRNTTGLPSGVTEETSVPVPKEDEVTWIQFATGGQPNDFTGTQNTELPYIDSFVPYESTMTVLDKSGNIYKQSYNGSGNIAWGWDYIPAYDSSSNVNPSKNGLYDLYAYELMFMRGVPRVNPTIIDIGSPIDKIYKSDSNQEQITSLKVILGTATVSDQLNIDVNPTLEEVKYIKIPYSSIDSNVNIENPTRDDFDNAYKNSLAFGYEAGDLISLNGWTEDELINKSPTNTKTLTDNNNIIVKDNCVLWVMTKTSGYNAILENISRKEYTNYYTDTTLYHKGNNVDSPNEEVYEVTNDYVKKTSTLITGENPNKYGLPLTQEGEVIKKPIFGFDEATIRAYTSEDAEYLAKDINYYSFVTGQKNPVPLKLDNLKYLEIKSQKKQYVHNFEYTRNKKMWVTITYKGRYIGKTTDIKPYKMDGLTGNEGIVNNQETVKKSTSTAVKKVIRTPGDVENSQPVHFKVDGGNSVNLNADKTISFDVTSDATVNNMEVIIYYNQAEIYVRQVVLNTNSEIVVPSNGYMILTNGNGKDSLNDYNFKVNSGDKESEINFKKARLVTDTINDKYVISPILPEFYSYYGYRMSNTELDHMNAPLKQAPEEIVADYSLENKYYITVYLEPTVSESKDIPFYNWDYKLNQFGKISK